jgi:hypothetical protein
MKTENTTETCPYCKEEIKPDAIKCKHCSSKLAPVMPSHNGTCPYCKEDIKPDAIKCKHCQSMINEKQDCGCSNAKDEKSLTSVLSRLILGHHGGPIGPWGGWCELGCTLDSLDCDWDVDPKGCSLAEVMCRDSCHPKFSRGGRFRI